MEGGQEPFGRLWHSAGEFNGRNSQGAFVAGITRRTVRWTPINRFEAWSSKFGTLGSRLKTVVSSCGGALQSRPDRKLLVVVAGGNTGFGHVGSGDAPSNTPRF